VGVEKINENSFAIKTLYNFRASMCEYETKTGKDLYMAIFKEGRARLIEELELKTTFRELIQ
jgi:hypothetical protein